MIDAEGCITLSAVNSPIIKFPALSDGNRSKIFIARWDQWIFISAPFGRQTIPVNLQNRISGNEAVHCFTNMVGLLLSPAVLADPAMATKALYACATSFAWLVLQQGTATSQAVFSNVVRPALLSDVDLGSFLIFAAQPNLDMANKTLALAGAGPAPVPTPSKLKSFTTLIKKK